MNLRRFATKRTLALGAAALAVAAGGGAAIAATSEVFDPEEEREAFQAAVAEELGVTTAELESAYKAAALERVDAAVEAGRITEEQADAMRERVESGDVFGPRLFFGGDHLGGPGDRLAGAADYLGLTQAELQERLRAGESLADIAKAEGKTVSGLKAAMLDVAKEKLDQAVSEGRITAAQREEMLERLESNLDDIVNGTLPEGGPGFGRPFGHRFGPGAGFAAPPDA